MDKQSATELKNLDEVEVHCDICGTWEKASIDGNPRVTKQGVFVNLMTDHPKYIEGVPHTLIRKAVPSEFEF